MDRPVLLFAYGTLQKKEIQIANFGRELTGRADALPGYRRRALILDDPKSSLAVVPDNWKTAVNRACRYMPEVNVTYQEMAAHYDVAVVPARPRKPRDKAKVEAGVQVAGRWLVAALLKRQFFSVGEVNEALAELLPRLNEKPFQKRSGCRRERRSTFAIPTDMGCASNGPLNRLMPLRVDEHHLLAW